MNQIDLIVFSEDPVFIGPMAVNKGDGDDILWETGLVKKELAQGGSRWNVQFHPPHQIPHIGDIVTEAGALWQYQQQHGIDFAEAQPGGHQFLKMSAEEEAKLREAVRPVRDEYVAMLNGKGFPGDEIADTAGEIMEKYNKMTYKAWTP